MNERPDPNEAPADPAGTRPKVDFETLLPDRSDAIDGSAVEEPIGAEESVAAEGDLLPDLRRPAGGMAVASEPREAPHAPRFQFLLGALLALGAVALAAALALSVGDTKPKDDGLAWSPWRPTEDPVNSIAKHIGREYRLPDGQQLVAVTGGGLQIAGLPMQIALRKSAADGGDISLIDGKGVLYRLCGLGPKCAIDKGKASQERHLLLRREALELALYTFRYVKDIDQVVVFMPPKLGQDPDQALLFRHGDVGPELSRPLRTTLSRRTPSVAGVTSSPDSQLVNRLTTSTLYSFSLTQANQDASVFLVLEPYDPNAAPQGSSGSSDSSSGSDPTTTTPSATKKASTSSTKKTTTTP